MLIVHSLVSRSYILDLRPGSSLVEYLTGGHRRVHPRLGRPDELDADNDLERYVDWYLPRAVAAVHRETGSAEVTLVGYCLGGVLAAIYAAGHEDAPVRNLILMATPVDFDEMGAMVALLRDGRLNAEELVDDTGNVPADALYSGFFMQAPTSRSPRRRRWTTCGTTNSSRGTRRWRSGRATMSRSRAPCSDSSSRSSCARTC